MKPQARFRFLTLGATLALTANSQAAPVTKAAGGTDLNDSATWGGTAPTSSDVATWSGTSLGSALTLGADAGWQGIKATGAASDVGITGAGTLTLGTAGIDLSTSTVNLAIANNIVLAGNQAWKAAAGKSLTATGVVSGSAGLTLGALAQSATYGSFLTGTTTTVFTNTSLADVTATNGLMGGAYVAGGNGNYLASTGYLLSNNGTTATYQMRILDGGFTKSVKVELTQSGSDITGKVLYARYIGGSDLTFNFDSGGNAGTIATAPNAAGYGAASTTVTLGYNSSGEITLAGANTYSGPTTISTTVKAGVASVANVSGAFGNNSAVTLSNATGANLNLNGFNTQLGSLTGGGGSGGNVQLGTAALTVGGDHTSPAAFAGIISGTGGSLAKIGTGTLTLSGANSYTGGSTVNAGKLVANHNTALGTGAVTLGATAENVSLYLGNRADVTNAVTVSAAGSGTVTLGADNTGSGQNAASFLGTLTLNRPTTISGEVSADRLALDGTITGNVGTLTITGGSRTTIQSTANNFTGNLVITGAGTILQASVATPAEVIPDSSSVTVGAGAFLQLASTGGAETIDALNGAGTVRTFPAGAFGAGLTVGSAGGSGDFSGSLVNGTAALSLTKTGAGIQTLSGTSTYTGATTVNAGTLLVTGALGNTAVTVNPTATFGGSGDLAGSLHFADGAKLAVNLADPLTVGGTVTFAGFDFDDLVGFDVETQPEGVYPILAGSSVTTANIGHLGIENAYTRLDGKQAYFQTGSLQVVVVPEPAVVMLGGLGLMSLLRRRRA